MSKNTLKSAKELLEDLDNAIKSAENPKYIELTINDGIGVKAFAGKPPTEEKDSEDVKDDTENEDNYNILNY